MTTPTINAWLAELDRSLQAADKPGVLRTEDEQRAGFAPLDLQRQRGVIDTLMTIDLLRAPRGRRPFDPESMRYEWKA